EATLEADCDGVAHYPRTYVAGKYTANISVGQARPTTNQCSVVSCDVETVRNGELEARSNAAGKHHAVTGDSAVDRETHRTRIIVRQVRVYVCNADASGQIRHEVTELSELVIAHRHQS